jgi:hydroxymethylpyrimidine pyrophosphatase-like HAD family hydrolase
VETLGVWRQLRRPSGRDPEPMVVIGGALVVEPHTGRTLWQKTIPPATADRCGQTLLQAGRTAMGLVDAWRWNLDYLVLRGKDYDRAKHLWLDKMPGVRMRFVDHFPDGRPDEPDVLRINTVVDEQEAAAVEGRLREILGAEVNLHAIRAPNYHVTVVEMFASRVDKWAGVKYIAQSYGLGAGAIAAVGDDINDLPMIRAAGLGVAMPQAIPAVKEAADIVAEDGLAALIGRITEARRSR